MQKFKLLNFGQTNHLKNIHLVEVDFKLKYVEHIEISQQLYLNEKYILGRQITLSWGVIISLPDVISKIKLIAFSNLIGQKMT